MDKLPWLRGLLLARVKHGGRVRLLQGRKVPAHHALPLQQRPDGRGRTLLLREGRRQRVEPGVEAVQDRPRQVRVPPRHGLHEDIRRARRAEGGPSHVRPARHARGGAEDNLHQHRQAREEVQVLLVRRVVPLERLDRHGELPAQLLDRRGGDRGRRTHHLPQDRVQGAPRPLRLLRRQREGRRIRHRPRVVHAPSP